MQSPALFTMDQFAMIRVCSSSAFSFFMLFCQTRQTPPSVVASLLIWPLRGGKWSWTRDAVARRGHQSKAHVSFSLIPCRLFLIDNSLVQIDFCVVFFFCCSPWLCHAFWCGQAVRLSFSQLSSSYVKENSCNKLRVENTTQRMFQGRFYLQAEYQVMFNFMSTWLWLELGY